MGKLSGAGWMNFAVFTISWADDSAGTLKEK